MKLDEALSQKCPVCSRPLKWECDPDGPDWSAWCCGHEYYIYIVDVKFERITNAEPPTDTVPARDR